MKKVLLIAIAAPLMLSACGGSPYRIESRDVVEPPPEVLTQDRLDAIVRERQVDMSKSGR